MSLTLEIYWTHVALPDHPFPVIWSDNWISSTCHHHLCAGVPNLHRRTRFFPCTSRSNFVGVHETHHSAFTGWWGIPLLWEDIISAVFYHAGGLMFANQKVVFHFLENYLHLQLQFPESHKYEATPSGCQRSQWGALLFTVAFSESYVQSAHVCASHLLLCFHTFGLNKIKRIVADVQSSFFCAGSSIWLYFPVSLNFFGSSFMACGLITWARRSLNWNLLFGFYFSA